MVLQIDVMMQSEIVQRVSANYGKNVFDKWMWRRKRGKYHRLSMKRSIIGLSKREEIKYQKLDNWAMNSAKAYASPEFKPLFIQKMKRILNKILRKTYQIRRKYQKL